MISASVAVEGGHGVSQRAGGTMTFVEPFLLSNKASPEFLRPLPKPAPLVAPRYNGSVQPLNGCRAPPARKFPLQPDTGAVNLVSKEEEDCPYRGLYPPTPSYHYPGGPYGALYPGHYTPLLPPYSPLQPPCSPPVKPGQSLLRPGKEGSLKHRILARPPEIPKRRSVALQNTNFTKGSLIQLASGELRRVEDMRTEDFVSSAEKSPALRLDPSTVVRIQEGSGGTARLTLSYGEHNTQVEFESALEHPFFVINQGWASCYPERTLQCYGLRCHRLQVGDVCVSLTPRTKSTKRAGNPRKRRWSAPDQFCNEDDEMPPASVSMKRKKD
ncbi:uncharacterized protein LOC110831632 [Zootermopsis nevadensis]|uniref:uncharacterized protein LOC110831632 n=1 Tax=Zootermopsis nevadensis TaxID=136037 RepID=UPI000B8E5402|nr:uncharacterized protein LOC110831632 [Zootermopsis nevadensis]XP_021923542.1 uncharacterized protein LOC110831632 [Zootermopsis nevadensis]